MEGVAPAEATEWLDCIVAPAPVPRPLAGEVKSAMGFVPGWLERLAPLPWLTRAAAGFGAHHLAHAPLALAEHIALIVTQDNSCRYCYGVQRAFFQILGYSDADVARLERDLDAADIPPQNRAALEFARRLSRGTPRPGAAELQELERHGFPRPVVAEFAYAAMGVLFMNRLATLLALPFEALERQVRSPLFRVVRPLVALWVRPRHHPGEKVVPNVGPCAAVVEALGDSPGARVVRTMVDDAFASPVLPVRTKALILGVIARGLGCDRGEADARALLARDGLDAAAVDDVLAHLASPRLDAREARLVPFARETIRYQVSTIQRRMRVVTAGMPAAETLEVAGMLALANAVCRLSVLLDAC